MADSSAVGVSMIGVDARYSINALQLRGQYYYAGLSNTDEYNVFTSEDGTLNDLGSAMTGYYVEAAYDVLRSHSTEKQLMPFLRYEYLDTHSDVEDNISKNPAYEKNIITTGLTLSLTQGAVVKADMQFVKSENQDEYQKTFNVGFGVMF